MKNQTHINLPDEVSTYNNEKIIIDTDDEFGAYRSLDQMRELKKQAEYGLYYPHNESVIDACEYMLDLRFA